MDSDFGKNKEVFEIFYWLMLRVVSKIWHSLSSRVNCLKFFMGNAFVILLTKVLFLFTLLWITWIYGFDKASHVRLNLYFLSTNNSQSNFYYSFLRIFHHCSNDLSSISSKINSLLCPCISFFSILLADIVSMSHTIQSILLFSCL